MPQSPIPPPPRTKTEESEPFTKAPDVPVDQISWRIDSEPYDGRARYVPYIDARVAADVLDEWVGPDRWECVYEEVRLLGTDCLWATMTIDFPTGRTVSRRDVGILPGGSDANVKIKGIVSDAFKRAAVAFGVGRNVYALPTVWATCKVDKRGKARPAPEATAEIAQKLEALGLGHVSAAVDEGYAVATDAAQTNTQPLSEDDKRDIAQRIENSSKVDVWRMYGIDQDGNGIPEMKEEAGKLWTEARAKVGPVEEFTEETRNMLVEIAERILDARAMERAGAQAVDPEMTAPFDTGEET